MVQIGEEGRGETRERVRRWRKKIGADRECVSEIDRERARAQEENKI